MVEKLKNKSKRYYKGILAILGIFTIMLCGVIGTGIINSNNFNSEITGLTSGLSSLSQSKIIQDNAVVSTDDKTILASAASKKYVGNRNTKKFHRLSCRNVKRMKKSNKVYFSTRKKAVKARYKACKHCHP